MGNLYMVAIICSLWLVLSACSETKSAPAPTPKEPESEATVLVDVDESANETQKSSSLPVVTNEEAKQLATDSLKNVIQTFDILGKQEGWDSEEKPADFQLLSPRLKEFATSSLVATKLKTIATSYYCQCDEQSIPNLATTVRFKVINNRPGQFSISAIQPLDEKGNGGTTIYLNMKYGKDGWKLNEWDEMTYRQKPLDISSDEYLEYLKKITPNEAVSFNKETTIEDEHGNQEKILLFKDDSGEFGVLAKSSERINEVQEDVPVTLPLEDNDVDLNKVTEVDASVVRSFTETYLRDLTEAINLNEFDRIQHYFEKDSTLFSEQQQLVKTLYDRTIREDLATVEVLEWTSKEANSYEVKTKEVMNITINEHTEEKEYYRVYTIVHENEKLVITQLESY
ncbi:hypothetical protein A2U94_03020 [Bacillus sp. VT 712]|uniref:TcaA protein NTF2-like domain-containing protein n=1 Tax=Priestia flexa TaxID=86664 RepID=A0ABU4J150_9BACI|nr:MULTISPECIES: hypothetical protein [Bacillaceae]KZB92952.1 hypothetical protein A2U94_03020 [Bacillus sp. VT 712]MCA1202622.1 hypothetical protein [Priestia flexa]MDW8514701.1 hypothetical protein [Priestia flexa]MED4590186.1 hypothetical protein [Priestia flexa]